MERDWLGEKYDEFECLVLLKQTALQAGCTKQDGNENMTKATVL